MRLGVHSIYITYDSDGMNTEWDDEHGIIAMGRYGPLKHEVDDAVTGNKWPSWDSPFLTP